MRACRITAEPLGMISIVDFKSEAGQNRHGTAEIKGFIPKRQKEEILKMIGSETWCTVYFFDEHGKKQVLFCGYLADIQISVEGDTYLTKAVLKTGTGLMDQTKHTRVYQNGGTTYRQIQEKHLAGYFQGNFLSGADAGSIGSMAVQYQETDWEFAKRLASRKNTVLFPNERSGGVKYIFGIMEGNVGELASYESYTIRRKKSSAVGAIKNNIARYRVRSREVWFTGDRITFLKACYIIGDVERKWEENELYNYYTLETAESLKQKTYYNERLSGASLSGKVTGISRDMVQISVSEDESGGWSGKKWFAYSTIYSSPDGTGWYCMPEKGDSVRLYFPGVKEEEAYVNSSVNKESSDTQARSNPDFKSIKNKQGKEVLFMPDKLVLTNNDGSSVEINDDDGITLLSDKDIIIKAKKNVSISSEEEEVGIKADSKIILEQGETMIELADDVKMSGGQVNMQ